MVSCPHCAERPVEYPNGLCLLEAGFMFHTQPRRYTFGSHWVEVESEVRNIRNQEYGWNFPERMYMVKGCSRTEHEQLMGTLKIRSGTARKVKRKLPEK